MDCLFGNWNVFGSDNKYLRVDRTNKMTQVIVYRTNAERTFGRVPEEDRTKRADQIVEWERQVRELTALQTSRGTQWVYGNISPEEIGKQIVRLLQNKQRLEKVGEIAKQLSNPEAGQDLKDRIQFLKEWLNWYELDIEGIKPSNRDGHTATLLRKTDEMLVFGGHCSEEEKIGGVSFGYYH